MLLPRPESRLSIKKVSVSLTKILQRSESCQRDVCTVYSRAERSRTAPHIRQFPPLWDVDEYRQRLRQHFDTQAPTQSDLTSSAFSDGSAESGDTEDPTDAVGSKHDYGQLENVFADDLVPSQPAGPENRRSMVAAAGSMPPRDGDVRQDGPDIHDQIFKSPSKATTDATRGMLSLSRGVTSVPNHLPGLCPDTVDQSLPYTALLSVNGSITVPQMTPEMQFLSTPATSYCPPSSDAHSTFTEEPRPSMSSRTDESTFEVEECSEQSPQSEELSSVAENGMSNPETSAPSPPRCDTILNGARTGVIFGSESTEERSLYEHGLTSLWKKLKSLKKRSFRPIVGRGRRRGG